LVNALGGVRVLDSETKTEPFEVVNVADALRPPDVVDVPVKLDVAAWAEGGPRIRGTPPTNRIRAAVLKATVFIVEILS